MVRTVYSVNKRYILYQLVQAGFSIRSVAHGADGGVGGEIEIVLSIFFIILNCFAKEELMVNSTGD